MPDMISGGGDHPDAAQDEAMMKEDLLPVIKEIGDRLADLEDIVYRMVTAFEGAVTGQKMQGLKSGIAEKFGPDLETLGPVFSDIYGGDLADELIHALGGQDGDLMEMAGQMLDGLKGKLGKYLPASSVSVEVGGVVDPSKEGEVEEEPKSEASQEPSRPLSASEQMIEKVRSMRSARKTA